MIFFQTDIVEVRSETSNRNRAGSVGVAATGKLKMVELGGIEPPTS